jgi:outer membrane protein OmpA-like peptidoglycan-associated protein
METTVATSSGEEQETTVAALEPAAVAGSTQPGAAAAPATPQAATQQAAKPQNPERQGKVESGQDGNVVITFATNSSYFPPGTTRRLGTMLKGLTSDQRYHVQLQVGVSGTDKVVGATSAEEARRYNKWLAERRMARVQEWLAENAQDRQLEIEPEFLADDSSRRVLIRIAPVS